MSNQTIVQTAISITLFLITAGVTKHLLIRWTRDSGWASATNERIWENLDKRYWRVSLIAWALTAHVIGGWVTNLLDHLL